MQATIEYNYFALLGPAVFVIGTILSMLYWSQLGKAGRAAVKATRRLWQTERDTVQGVAFLAGTFLLALGYTWLRWILTHNVE